MTPKFHVSFLLGLVVFMESCQKTTCTKNITSLVEVITKRHPYLQTLFITYIQFALPHLDWSFSLELKLHKWYPLPETIVRKFLVISA